MISFNNQKRTIARIVINFSIGSLVTLIFAKDLEHITLSLFLRVQLLAFIVSFTCSYIGRKIVAKPYWFVISVLLLVGNVAGIAGICIERLVVYGITETFSMYDRYQLTVIMSIVTAVTIIITLIDKYEYNVQANIKSDEVNNTTTDHLQNKAGICGKIQLKEGKKIYYINTLDIIFLHSAGRKSVIYTENRNYEIQKRFKEMQYLLARTKFLRIHKQYIINREFIEKIEHYKDGKYFVYLNDEERNVLPLSRYYVTFLKKQLLRPL